MITGNEPASPIFLQHGLSNDCHTDPGLTIRQYYAGLAMQGMLIQNLAVDRALNEVNNSQVNALVQASVKCADALIAELNKNK